MNGTHLNPRRVSDRRGILERHVQTVLVMLAVAAMLWVGTTLVALQGDTRVINSTLISLQDEMKSAALDRYTVKMAEADQKLRDFQIQAANRRLDELEKLVSAIIPTLSEISQAVMPQKGKH